jgi:hypothetical protein
MKDLNQTCDRSDDLVAFLYSELSEKETSDFQLHLHECSRCEQELGSFGEIRESIVSWRDAWLSTLTPSGESRIRFATAAPRRSGLVALREFFNLSPLWMKGAVAFASLLFCVCAALAVGYMTRTRQTLVVNTPSDRIYTQEDVNKRVEAAVQAKETSLRATNEKQLSNAPAPENLKPRKAINSTTPSRGPAYANNTRNLRKPLSQRERMELAMDLGLLSSRDDDDIDIVTDRITPR